MISLTTYQIAECHDSISSRVINNRERWAMLTLTNNALKAWFNFPEKPRECNKCDKENIIGLDAFICHAASGIFSCLTSFFLLLFTADCK